MPLIDEIKVPLISVNDTTLTVVNIPLETGAEVKKGDLILVFETSKTTYDVVAEHDGFIQVLCNEGSDYAVSEVVARFFTHKEEIPYNEGAPNQTGTRIAASEIKINWQGETIFSPAALTLINQLSIDKSEFSGRDYVNKIDVELFTGIKKISLANTVSSQLKHTSNPLDSKHVKIQKISSNKKREITYLSEVQSTGLTSTIHTMIHTEGIFTNLNASLKYLKNSLLPIIIFEVGRLLPKYRLLNAFYTGDSISLYEEINIGFAIDVDKGLKVLNIKNANNKSIFNIEDDIINLSNKYLDDKLSIDDLSNITFTITDLSAEGVFLFKPLINSMNSAILGISSIDQRLNRCNLSLTFDHRITEGKQVAKFLNELKINIESYRSSHFSKSARNVTCFKCFKKLENDLSSVGFAKCITPEGEESYICQSCFKGY